MIGIVAVVSFVDEVAVVEMIGFIAVVGFVDDILAEQAAPAVVLVINYLFQVLIGFLKIMISYMSV